MLLPFSVLSSKRKEPFTRDIEVAALFSLAEIERFKGGGLIIKQPEEESAFIAKVGYPIWLASWNKNVLVFDGLNKSSYAVKYSSIPDVKVFVSNLRRSAKTRETHLAFLRDHLNYFEISDQERSLVVDGLIKNSEFLVEFDAYRREASEIGGQILDGGLLAHVIEETTIQAELQDLEALFSSFKEDVPLLNRCMKFLNRVTNHYLRLLRRKNKGVKDEFAAKIKQEEKNIAPKVELLKDDYDARITEVAKNFERQRLPVQKEKVKLEKAKENAYEKIERCKLEASGHSERGNKVGEKRWKEKCDAIKKDVSEIENQLKQSEKSLKDLEDRRSLEIFKLRDELEGRVKETRRNLLELEASRDAKITILKQEMERLEAKTKSISDLIGKAVKLRESDIASLGKLGFRKELGFEGNALYYVPFYVTRYATETNRRYFILPPSFVSAIGLTTKLKGALGKTQIKQLLVPRFRVVSSLLDTIKLLLQENAAFESEIREIGEKHCILARDNVVDEIKSGLSFLKKEGWVKDKECDSLMQRLASIETKSGA